MTAKRIVVTFFEKPRGKKPLHPVYLTGRMTITYDAFRRFEVTTDSDIHLPGRTQP